MASLKLDQGFHLGTIKKDFHDRKVMASLKLRGLARLKAHTLNFHDRKVMASLKPIRRFCGCPDAHISMIERSWPH